MFPLDACTFSPEGFERSFPLRSTRTSFGHLSEDEPDPSELESGLPDDDVPWTQETERERDKHKESKNHEQAIPFVYA